MSVVTTADERLREAKEHVGAAVAAISDILIGKCWGHDNYGKDYRHTLLSILTKLLEIEEQL